jgi:hypothetical protein
MLPGGADQHPVYFFADGQIPAPAAPRNERLDAAG